MLRPSPSDLAVLELVTHRIAVVGARFLQELVEVIVPGRALILEVGRRDFAGGGWPAVLLVLPPIAARGGPVGVVSFRLCRGLLSRKDGSHCLLTRGMVGGDVQKLASGMRLLAP